MINKKTVAVIIPLYFKDNPIFFSECLSSVFSMAGGLFHVFVCCDGKITKDLHEVIMGESYRDNFTVYCRSENKGISITLNELIDNVLFFENFKYIVRMDADDICFPDRLEKQINFMENNIDVDVSGGGCIEFGSIYAMTGVKCLPLLHAEIYKSIFKKCPFIHPSVIFRRSVFEKGYRYPINTPYTEDLAFWFHLLYSGFKFANISEPVIKYRTSFDALKRRRGLNKAWQELKLRLKYIILLKRFSLNDIFWSFSHFFIRILPISMYSFLYKKLR